MRIASCMLLIRADEGGFKARAMHCDQKVEGLRWSLTP